ncbi:MAG: coenzyme F420-reducing hydrogenase, FrhD protein [Methanosphaera sp.]|nr:coenzyme F420-reducing hydrogenase, FrhD protein [Methanosphaera sp.]
MSYNHENLIVGCGNILYGDDGFGPEVIRQMNEENIVLPGDTCLVDGGTGAPHYLFTLPEDEWKNIIIIDIASLGEDPGTICVLDIDDVKEEERYMDVHGISATYPLHSLKDKVNIKLVVCQPEYVPIEMDIGLSRTVQNRIDDVIELTIDVLNDMIDI